MQLSYVAATENIESDVIFYKICKYMYMHVMKIFVNAIRHWLY